MSGALLSGAGIGVGVLIVIASLQPRVPAIESVIGRVTGVQGSDMSSTDTRWLSLFRVRAVGGTSRWLEASRFHTDSLRRDMAIAGTNWEALSSQALLSALALGGTVPVITILLFLAGSHVSVTIPAAALAFLAVAGAVIPFFSLRRDARHRRAHFRHALGSFLELVSLGMAGAMGVESSLDGASTISGDWPFELIRVELQVARHRGEAPWDALGRLGDRIGVEELVQLAANLGLAGTEGARIRTSLTSKAATLRTQEMSEAESEANAMTEKMFLPGVFLLAGFMVLVGFPAIAHVFHSL